MGAYSTTSAAPFGVMITNGPGGHPAWKHAEQTANKLIIDPFLENDFTGEKKRTAAELRRQLIIMLEGYHDEFGHEQSRASQFDRVDLFAEDILQRIVKWTKGTILEGHFARLGVQAALRLELSREFRTQQLIHRSWQAAS